MDRYCVFVIAAIFVTAVLAGDNEKENSIADDKRIEGFWKRGLTESHPGNAASAGFWKRDASNLWYGDDEDEKRAKYFLGKRAKYFLGKRMDETMDDLDEDSLADEDLAEKRAKYFLGKRAKYFLGKRAKYFLGKRADAESESELPEAQELAYELGKRQHSQGFDNVIRRAKYFLGKRAKYFLGKRSDELESEEEKRAKYFLGKRGATDDGDFGTEKRQQKYFLGKRSVDKQE